MKITESFIKETNRYDIFQIPNELYLNYFNKLEKAFDECSFEDDERFVTYGRLGFFQDELTERLNDKRLKYEDSNWKGKWDNRLGAFWDLFDFINGDRYFTSSQVPKEADFHNLINENN